MTLKVDMSNKKKNDLSILVKDISEIFYPSANENGVSIENSFSDSLLIDYLNQP